MDIKDYQVRVWDKDIFILSEGINYWGGDNNGGLQCNFIEDSTEYNEIMKICNIITDNMLKLNKLLKDND